MKNAANCVNQCELQDTLIIDVSNAHGGPGSLPGPRPVEGRLLPKRDFAVISRDDTAPRTVPRSLSREGERGRFRARLLPSDDREGSFPFFFSLRDGSWRSVSPSAVGPGRRIGRSKGAPPMISLRSFSRPQLGRDDPLNLSILLRGGKENNDDSLSKGD